MKELKLGMGVSVKAENDWRGVDCLMLQCIAIATYLVSHQFDKEKSQNIFYITQIGLTRNFVSKSRTQKSKSQVLAKLRHKTSKRPLHFVEL